MPWGWVRFVIGMGPRCAGGLVDWRSTGGGRFDMRASWSFRLWVWVGLIPQLVSNGLRLDPELRPPSHFIAGSMELAMMAAAERHRELITGLDAEAPGLRETQVMGIRWLAATDHTGLCGNKFAMAFVASPSCLRRDRVLFKI